MAARADVSEAQSLKDTHGVTPALRRLRMAALRVQFGMPAPVVPKTRQEAMPGKVAMAATSSAGLALTPMRRLMCCYIGLGGQLVHSGMPFSMASTSTAALSVAAL